jgi:hypothetical protein
VDFFIYLGKNARSRHGGEWAPWGTLAKYEGLSADTEGADIEDETDGGEVGTEAAGDNGIRVQTMRLITEAIRSVNSE